MGETPILRCPFCHKPLAIGDKLERFETLTEHVLDPNDETEKLRPVYVCRNFWCFASKKKNRIFWTKMSGEFFCQSKHYCRRFGKYRPTRIYKKLDKIREGDWEKLNLNHQAVLENCSESDWKDIWTPASANFAENLIRLAKEMKEENEE